jgi:hypothetical protein
MEGLLVSLFGRLQESDGGKERKTSSLQNYLHQVIKSCLICLLYKKNSLVTPECMQILRNNFMYFHGLASVLPLKMNRTLVLTSRDPSFAPLPLPPVPGSLLHPSPMSFKIWGCNINNDRLSSVPCCPCLSAIVTGHSQHVINSSYGNE